MKVYVQVTEDEIRGLLCSAFEGGSNYWIEEVDYVFPEGLCYDDFRHGNKMQPQEEYWHPNQIIPMTKGCVMKIRSEEGTNDLTRDKIEKGLQLLVNDKDYKHHFADFIKGNDDATTGDVFLQFCLFGKVIFV